MSLSVKSARQKYQIYLIDQEEAKRTKECDNKVVGVVGEGRGICSGAGICFFKAGIDRVLDRNRE